MMRNTSPIGWLPILFIKMYKDKSFKALLIAGFIIALPLLAILILIDTHYYASDTLVITSMNFLKVNLIEGLSKYFGDDPFYWYILVFLPGCVTVLFPFALVSYYVYYKDQTSKLEVPYICYYVVFYLGVFSLIGHKEIRFLIPILPFTFLMVGYFVFKNIKNRPKTFKYLIIISFIVETAIFLFLD
jgi:phosphatidylinositol glycan class B